MNYSKKNIDRIKITQRLSEIGIIYAPDGFKESTPENLLAICNGCGSAQAKFDFVPDRIYGTYIGHACQIHDYMYYVGEPNEEARREADRTFKNNMMRLIERDCKDKWYKPKGLMRLRAKLYYRMVRDYGGSAFWDGKN